MTYSWLTGSIPERTQIIAVTVSVLLFLFIVQLIRRGRLKEGYSLVWFCIALATVFLSMFAGLLDVLAHWLGITYVPAVLFVVMIGGLYVLGIHFSLLLHRFDRRIRTLAQEHAMLKQQLEERPVPPASPPSQR